MADTGPGRTRQLGTSSTASPEAADRAREGMLSVFQAQPGFRAYGLAQAQVGNLVSVSL
jgi:hypothetical protein